MKQSVARHKENLKNFTRSIEAKRFNVRKETEELARWEIDLELRTRQIAMAEAEGRLEYDDEKFCVPRKKKDNENG